MSVIIFIEAIPDQPERARMQMVDPNTQQSMYAILNQEEIESLCLRLKGAARIGLEEQGWKAKEKKDEHS